jgi:hypothetical protein
MSTIYDGIAFGALDSDTYDADEFLGVDTWLRRKNENNIAWLYVADPPVTVCRRGGVVPPGGGLSASPAYPADRAICSVRASIFVAVPVYIESTVTMVRISINAVTKLGGVLIGGAVVLNSSGRKIGTLPEARLDQSTEYADAGLVDYDIEVQSSEEGWALAYLTVRSDMREDLGFEKSTSGSGAFSPGGAFLNVEYTSYVYDPDVAPSPNIIDPVFDHAFVNNEYTGANVDVIAFDNLFGSAYQLVTDLENGIGHNADMTFIGIGALSYMQMRSYTVQLFRRYEKRVAELFALVPDRGIDVLRQVQTTRLLRARRKILACGPTGYYPPDRPSIMGEHPRIYEYARSEVETAPWPAYDLVSTYCPDPYETGDIEVILYVRCCNRVADGEGTVDWVFDVTVDNFTNSETVTTTRSIATGGTGNIWSSASSPKAWIDNMITTVAANSFGTSIPYYTAKDGQILPTDLGKLTRVVVRVPMPAGGTGEGVTVRVEATYDANIQELTISRPDGQNRTNMLCCVAWSVVQIPGESA